MGSVRTYPFGQGDEQAGSLTSEVTQPIGRYGRLRLERPAQASERERLHSQIAAGALEHDRLCDAVLLPSIKLARVAGQAACSEAGPFSRPHTSSPSLRVPAMRPLHHLFELAPWMIAAWALPAAADCQHQPGAPAIRMSTPNVAAVICVAAFIALCIILIPLFCVHLRLRRVRHSDKHGSTSSRMRTESWGLSREPSTQSRHTARSRRTSASRLRIDITPPEHDVEAQPLLVRRQQNWLPTPGPATPGLWSPSIASSVRSTLVYPPHLKLREPAVIYECTTPTGVRHLI